MVSSGPFHSFQSRVKLPDVHAHSLGSYGLQHARPSTLKLPCARARQHHTKTRSSPKASPHDVQQRDLRVVLEKGLDAVDVPSDESHGVVRNAVCRSSSSSSDARRDAEVECTVVAQCGVVENIARDVDEVKEIWC